MPPFLRIRKLTIQPEQSLASSPSPHNHSSIANNARMPSNSKPEHVSIAALPTHQRQPHQQEATGLRRSSRIVRGDGQNGESCSFPFLLGHLSFGNLLAFDMRRRWVYAEVRRMRRGMRVCRGMEGRL